VQLYSTNNYKRSSKNIEDYFIKCFLELTVQAIYPAKLTPPTITATVIVQAIYPAKLTPPMSTTINKYKFAFC
tara:strand:- start:323 stop:541 length:219 start_codon:yes stop_codon:yes gene_type:complete